MLQKCIAVMAEGVQVYHVFFCVEEVIDLSSGETAMGNMEVVGSSIIIIYARGLAARARISHTSPLSTCSAQRSSSLKHMHV